MDVEEVELGQESGEAVAISAYHRMVMELMDETSHTREMVAALREQLS